MKIPLTVGAYETTAIIAEAQRCVNLYAEENPPDAPMPFTYYPTPGLLLLIAGPVFSKVRQTYRASNGELYRVVGGNVYFVSQNFVETLLGTIPNGTQNVWIKDNGLVLVIVDGSSRGWCVELSTKIFGEIDPTNFYGGTTIDYVDTYLLFNRPGTAQWYITLSNATFAMLIGGTAFDPLDIAAKTGSPDPIVGLIVMHREVWLLGKLTSEVWFDAGAPDFAFEEIPGTFVEHGCCAVFSIAAQDLSIYWLSEDREGKRMILVGNQYAAKRISTHAMEQAIQKYSQVNDAVAYTYQQSGHVFYVITFPTAQKTWAYDEASKLWHERNSIDADGNLLRHRSNCAANAYDKNVVGDYENGNLYAFDVDTYTDNGTDIPRIRSFPHLINELKRVSYSSFTADMAVGEDADATPDDPPLVSLRWSDDRGKSYGNALEQSLGAGGQYLTTISWSRLGMARDRVFELSWSMRAATALNGAYINIVEAAS